MRKNDLTASMFVEWKWTINNNKMISEKNMTTKMWKIWTTEFRVLYYNRTKMETIILCTSLLRRKWQHFLCSAWHTMLQVLELISCRQCLHYRQLKDTHGLWDFCKYVEILRFAQFRCVLYIVLNASWGKIPHRKTWSKQVLEKSLIARVP